MLPSYIGARLVVSVLAGCDKNAMNIMNLCDETITIIYVYTQIQKQRTGQLKRKK